MRVFTRLTWAVAGATITLSQPSAAADLPNSFRPSSPIASAAAAPALLGTNAIPIRADRFSESLRRAHEDASASPVLQRLIAPARYLNRMSQVQYVQRAITSAIRWESDATQWGEHDYWASASQTLARGAGDMEDRAIVKLQALRTLGFSPNDLFLTLARDRVGGPETVLTVRLDGRYYIVDDTGGTPYPAEQRRFEFQPIISFGWNGAWLHARPTVTAAASVASASPARN